ncbi:MAG: oligosaccharide flippase family protein [Planctomycetota bacterium]
MANDDLKRAAIRGGAFTLAAQGVQIAAQVGALIVLAQLLRPSQFGLAVMATVILSIATVAADFGVSVLVVQRRELSPRRALRIGLGTGVLIALFLLLFLVLFEVPMRGLLTLGAFGIAVAGVGATARGCLERELKFARIAGLEALLAVAVALIKVDLAQRGAGAAAIVCGDAIGAGLYATAMLLAAQGSIGPKDPGPRSPVYRDGGRIVGMRMFDTGFGQMDRFLIGSLHSGIAMLGIYGFAYQHAMFLAARLGPVTERVALPLLSRLREQPAALADAYRALTRVHSLALTGPALLLYALAPTLVDWLYPERWSDAVPAMQALCLAAAAHGLNSRPGLLWIALGHIRMRFLWSVVNLGVTAVILWFAVPHGLEATAYALAARSTAATVVAQWLTHRVAPSIRHADYLRAIAPAAALTTLLLLLLAAV